MFGRRSFRPAFLAVGARAPWGPSRLGRRPTRRVALTGFHASETIATEKGGPKDRSRTAKSVGAEAAERLESTSQAGQKWIEGGTSPALRAGEGEDRGRWRGARWRTPWSGSGPARWTVAERPWGGTSRGVRPGARSAEAREGSKRIPRRAEPEEKKRRARPPGVLDGGGHARDVPRFREGRASEALSSAMPEPVERSSVSSWWRVAHNASSFPPPLWGSGHGIAEVSQDPETQGVAAKGYALFGVGSALGAATERDPHRIGLGRCQRTKRAEVRWRAAGRRLHFDSPKAKPGPAAAPRLARGGPGLGRAPGQIYIQQLSELL